jgi:hypothetical protein
MNDDPADSDSYDDDPPLGLFIGLFWCLVLGLTFIGFSVIAWHYCGLE